VGQTSVSYRRQKTIRTSQSSAKLVEMSLTHAHGKKWFIRIKILLIIFISKRVFL